MKHPSAVSNRVMPAGEQQRQRQHRIPRQALGRGGGGGGEQEHLGGGVEPDPEHDPDEEHVPGLGDRAHEPAEEPPHQPAGLQLALEFVLVEQALPHAAEDLDDAGQDHEVERGDQVQERRGQRGADDPAERLDTRSSGRPPRRTPPGPRWPARRRPTMMMEECPRAKKNPVRQRPVAVGHQLAGGVVDRRDVVGVEGVPGAESPRGQRHAQAEAEPGELEMVRGDREGEDAPAADVQGQDHQGHGAEPAPLAPGQLACGPLRRPVRAAIGASSGGRTGGPGAAPDVPPFLRGLVTSAQQPGDRARPLEGA